MLIGARTPLAGPIGRDQAPPAREPVRNVLEVATAMRDRMQADDWKSVSAIVVSQLDAIDLDRSAILAGAKRKSFRLRTRC
jgi:hypothetical protein